jgi:hypothetical protein
VQPELQGVEVEAVRGPDHDLSINHAIFRQLFQERLVQLREITVEWPEIAALDEDVRRAAKDDGAESVPFRLEEKAP